jgi:hypothetical protein
VKPALVSALLVFAAASLSAQMLRLTDLNTTQIERLDRARTVILMPGGVLEEHGPYLPAFSDGFMNEWWTERLGEALARENWTVLVFPMLPLGDGYFGAPHLATAAYGAKIMHRRLDVLTPVAFEILAGKDPRSIPRYSTGAMVREKAIMDDGLAYDESVRRKQEAWKKKNGVD